MKLSDHPLGSVASRALIRSKLENAERQPGQILKVQVIHIGYDGKSPLPVPLRLPWQGGVTEIVHIAGRGLGL